MEGGMSIYRLYAPVFPCSVHGSLGRATPQLQRARLVPRSWFLLLFSNKRNKGSLEKWPALGLENEVLLELPLKDPIPGQEAQAGVQPQDKENWDPGSEAKKWVDSGRGQYSAMGFPFTSPRPWALCCNDLLSWKLHLLPLQWDGAG